MFLEHYLRCIATFRGIDVSASDDLGDVAIVPEQAEWLLGKAEQQAQFIYETIHRELAEFEAQTKDSFGRARGLSVGFVSSLRRTGRNLRTRIPLISGQQTQDVVEDTRMRVAVEEGGEGVIKTWITMLDHKVRTAHRFAHGQEKPVEEPFIVGGFQLRMPGDGTLGAPLRLLINCRCVARYRTETGTDPIGETPRLVPVRPRRPGERVRPGESPPLRPSPEPEPPEIVFTPGEEIAKDQNEFTEWARKWAKGFEDKEAIRAYAGNDYVGVNNFLRGRIKFDPAAERTDKFAKKIRSMDIELREFMRGHPLKQDVLVYRGQRPSTVNFDVNDLSAGDEITQPAYTSTSVFPKIAGGFGQEGSDALVWRIKVRKDTPATPASVFEGEVILPPRTKLTVESVQQVSYDEVPEFFGERVGNDRRRVTIIDARAETIGAVDELTELLKRRGNDFDNLESLMPRVRDLRKDDLLDLHERITGVRRATGTTKDELAREIEGRVSRVITLNRRREDTSEVFGDD